MAETSFRFDVYLPLTRVSGTISLFEGGPSGPVVPVVLSGQQRRSEGECVYSRLIRDVNPKGRVLVDVAGILILR